MTGKRRPQLEDVESILEEVAGGRALRAICVERGIHPGHMHDLLDSTTDLREQYARAREHRADFYQEQMVQLGIAAALRQKVDGQIVDPAGARVALDAIKWATARMAPKKAPVMRLELVRQLTDEELDAQLAQLEGGADAPDA